MKVVADESVKGPCTFQGLYLNPGEREIGPGFQSGKGKKVVPGAEGGEQGLLYLQLEPGVVFPFFIRFSCLESPDELVPVGVDLEDVQGESMGLGKFESRFKIQEG